MRPTEQGGGETRPEGAGGSWPLFQGCWEPGGLKQGEAWPESVLDESCTAGGQNGVQGKTRGQGSGESPGKG